MHEIRFAVRAKYFARSTKFFAVRAKYFAGSTKFFAQRPKYFTRSTKFFAVSAKDLPVIARLFAMPDPYFAVGAGFPREIYLTVPLGFTPYSSL